MPTSPLPRLLLLEDDPVSASFLRQALATLPARIEHVATVAAAESMADPEQAVWLFDAHLPDGHAADLLPRLRARGLATPALALTADADDDRRQRLLDAGFARVLAKPIAGETLRTLVRENLRDVAPPPRWNDDDALAALGSVEAVQGLRRLFLQELPDQCRDVATACVAGDHASARERLHRLKSGCGFVGATALLAIVRELDAAPGDAAALARFERGVAELSGD